MTLNAYGQITKRPKTGSLLVQSVEAASTCVDRHHVPSPTSYELLTTSNVTRMSLHGHSKPKGVVVPRCVDASFSIHCLGGFNVTQKLSLSKLKMRPFKQMHCPGIRKKNIVKQVW